MTTGVHSAANVPVGGTIAASADGVGNAPLAAANMPATIQPAILALPTGLGAPPPNATLDRNRPTANAGATRTVSGFNAVVRARRAGGYSAAVRWARTRARFSATKSQFTR